MTRRLGALPAPPWLVRSARPGSRTTCLNGYQQTFKDYEPGFLHIDIKYLLHMPDEQQRRYLFVAIDRATRWVYMEIYADQTDGSSVDFLTKVTKACPVKIIKLLTDNGRQSCYFQYLE